MSEAARIDELAALRAENALLRAALADRENAGAEALSFPAKWRLTFKQARLLKMLVDKGGASYEAISLALWCRGEDPHLRRNINTLACRLRRKFAGIANVQAIYGFGYILDDPGRERLRAAAQAGQDLAAARGRQETKATGGSGFVSSPLRRAAVRRFP